MESAQCKICSKCFKSVSSLNSHVAKQHGIKTTKFPCEICDRDFKSRQSLWNHRKTIHSNVQFEVKRKSDVKCGECNEVLDSVSKLCEHLNGVHGFDVKIEEFNFKSKLDYENWRKDVERKGRFEFVASQGGVIRNNAIKQYLRCHRSGVFKSKSKGIRAPKTVQTNRINYHCCAFATVSISIMTEEVTVKACLQHYGHDDLLIRVRLSKGVQETVGELLKEGRDPDYILNFFKSIVFFVYFSFKNFL